MTKKGFILQGCRRSHGRVKAGPLKKKPSRGERISKAFSILLGLLILISLIFTLLGILR